MDDKRIFGITKLKLQAALEMILGDMRVTSMMERSSIQIPDRYMINIRVYLRRSKTEIRSREFSRESQSLTENVENKSQSRLNARDCRTFFLVLVLEHDKVSEILGLVSMCEIE